MLQFSVEFVITAGLAVLGALGGGVGWMTAMFVRQGRTLQKLDEVHAAVTSEVKPQLVALQERTTRHSETLKEHGRRIGVLEK